MSQSASSAVWFSTRCLIERAEDVGHRLVERAGLEHVDQAGLVLGDAVGELVADDVERAVNPLKISPSPSPKTICWPFQNALL